MEVLEDEPLDVEVGVVGRVLQLLQTLLGQFLWQQDDLFIFFCLFLQLCLSIFVYRVVNFQD